MEDVVAEVGCMDPVMRSMAGEGGLTVMVVHGPQLSFSFDSVMTPVKSEDFLSAHARTDHVPVEVKVCVTSAVLLLPVRSPPELYESFV